MSDVTAAGELLELIDARFDEVTPTRVSGSIAADERHHQPWGMVHWQVEIRGPEHGKLVAGGQVLLQNTDAP
jgi:hypothetical protein